MRIIAGEWRGRRLAALGKGDAKSHLRPTTDRTRESLFSILQGGRFGDVISDAKVLDLFAGTGALGLEALSRGANQATFVEKNRAALALLQENLQNLKANGTILKSDATKLPRGDAADLVFLDPPYGKKLGEMALNSAAQSGRLTSGAFVVWEENSTQLPPHGFSKVEERKFGDTWITFLTYEA